MKRILIGVSGLFALGATGVLGIGWYYTGELEKGAFLLERDSSEFPIVVSSLGADTITLRLPDGTKPEDSPGTMGLKWEDGSSIVGPVITVVGQDTIRRNDGIGTPSAGDKVRLDKFVFAGDPESALGIPFAEVAFPAPLGDLGAWFIDGGGSTWAIFVHGMGSTRREALRVVPLMVEVGIPVMVIDYRNDEGVPEDPSSYYQYGLTEWEDLEAAIRYGVLNGADDFLLVGYSMGGAIVSNFLFRSDLADRVSALVLDSPMLDFSATVDLGGRNRGIPSFITATAKLIAGMRLGVEWNAMDYLGRAEDYDVPILLFHSETDGRVPVSISDELAEARPDIVTYERFAAAAHVGGWNLDQGRYEEAIRVFLSEVVR